MQVTVDKTKCSAPEKCGRCLQVCSPQVFVLCPEKNNGDVDIEPRKWVVEPVWEEFCTKCYACVRKCPQNAITIVQ